MATDVVGKNRAVSTDVEQPHPNGAVTVAEERKRPTWRRWLVLGVVVAIALLWTFAIWYSVTRESPEDLDDDALDRARAIVRDGRDPTRSAAGPSGGTDGSRRDRADAIRKTKRSPPWSTTWAGDHHER